MTDANPTPGLKPCPFCGSPPEIEHSYHEDNHRYPRDFWHVRIRCTRCGMAGTEWSAYGNQEQEVANFHVREKAEKDEIAAWNTRAAEAQIADLTSKLEMAERALEAIRLGDTEVYDDDLECLVTVSADAEETSAWAEKALAAIRGDGHEG